MNTPAKIKEYIEELFYPITTLSGGLNVYNNLPDEVIISDNDWDYLVSCITPPYKPVGVQFMIFHTNVASMKIVRFSDRNL